MALRWNSIFGFSPVYDGSGENSPFDLDKNIEALRSILP